MSDDIGLELMALSIYLALLFYVLGWMADQYLLPVVARLLRKWRTML